MRRAIGPSVPDAQYDQGQIFSPFVSGSGVIRVCIAQPGRKVIRDFIETDIHVGRNLLGKDVLVFDRYAGESIPDGFIHILVRGDDDIADLVKGLNGLLFDNHIVDDIAQEERI